MTEPRDPIDGELVLRPLRLTDMETVRRFIVEEADPLYGVPQADPLPGQSWLQQFWPGALAVWVLVHPADVVAALAVVHDGNQLDGVAWCTISARPSLRGSAELGQSLDLLLQKIGDRWPLRKLYVAGIAGTTLAAYLAASEMRCEVELDEYVWVAGGLRDLRIYARWFDRSPDRPDRPDHPAPAGEEEAGDAPRAVVR